MTQILVVDDSPSERHRIGRLLESSLARVSVAYAADGKDAIETVRTTIPDLILTDLVMPNVNGLELVQNLSTKGYGIPIVLMTSIGNDDVAFQALCAGATSYVPKEAVDRRLIRTVEGLLSLSTTQQSRHHVLGLLTDVESQFQLRNDTSVIRPLIAHLQEQIANMELFDALQLTRIGVALHESLINAIDHGNLELNSEWRQNDPSHYHQIADERRQQAPYRDRRVNIVARLSAHFVRFVISDEGPGFDPASTHDPLTEHNHDRVGGRGLLLIRSFMDQVRHNETGNEITMTKYVKRSDVASQN